MLGLLALASRAQLCSFCAISPTGIHRTRMDPRHKARVEKNLGELGLTPSQAINLLFAQIDRRKAIPFALSLEENSDILPPIQHVAKVWDQLDSEDFSHLDPR